MDNQREPTGDDGARVGRNLKAARERAGMSQTALAHHMASKGFTAWRQTTVSRTERGERELLASEMFTLDTLFPGLWDGTSVARTMRTVGNAIDTKRIEAQMDKIGAELDQLRTMWGRHKRAQELLNASVDKAEDRNANAETDIDSLLATANLKRTEPGEDASDRG